MRLVRLERQQSRVADDVRAALASLGRGSTVIGGIALVGVGSVTERPIEAVVLLPHGVIIVIGVDLPDPALRLEAPLGGPWKADGWPLIADDDAINPATDALDVSQACEQRIASLVPGTGPVGTIVAVGPYVETVDQPAGDLAGPVRVLHPTPTTMLAATVSLATAHRPRSVEQVRALIRGLAPEAPEFSDEVLVGEGFSRFTDDSPPESLWDSGPSVPSQVGTATSGSAAAGAAGAAGPAGAAAAVGSSSTEPTSDGAGSGTAGPGSPAASSSSPAADSPAVGSAGPGSPTVDSAGPGSPAVGSGAAGSGAGPSSPAAESATAGSAGPTSPTPGSPAAESGSAAVVRAGWQTKAPVSAGIEPVRAPAEDSKSTEPAPIPAEDSEPAEPAPTPAADPGSAEPASSPAVGPESADLTPIPATEPEPAEPAPAPAADPESASPAHIPAADPEPAEPAPTPATDPESAEPEHTPATDPGAVEPAPTPAADQESAGSQAAQSATEADPDEPALSADSERTEVLPSPAAPSVLPLFPGATPPQSPGSPQSGDHEPAADTERTENLSFPTTPARKPSAPQAVTLSQITLPPEPRPFPTPRPAPSEPAPSSKTVRWLPLGAIGLLVALVVAAIAVATSGDDPDAAPTGPPTPATQPPPSSSAAPAQSLQFALRAADRDQRCASHAFGDAQASLQQTSCSGVRRASYAATVDGRGAAVTVGIVEFPDAAQAGAFKAVADTPGGGGILDLASETGKWGATPAPRFENAAYTSRVEGTSVRVVQAVWAPGPSTPDDPGLARAANAALDLPAQ
ncbi:hypothetical protein [Amycolatopsis sp. NPDC051371]|uniref:hypothetical protein n=1 Tax=Amycolatopsis sp. NPDC051371 TaxID=3155800 RepID=UPI0034289E12